ncbi:4208_t:CDS:1, partial [Funneliformis geosporum]
SLVNSDINRKESEIKTDKSEVDEESELEINIVESKIEELVTSKTDDESN